MTRLTKWSWISRVNDRDRSADCAAEANDLPKRCKMTRHRIKCIAVLAAAVSLFADVAGACTFEAGPAGLLDIGHPGSLSVAVAVARAKDQGTLPSRDLARSALGYHRAVGEIMNFASGLGDEETQRSPKGSRKSFVLAHGEVEAQRSPQGFSLLLVGPRLWSAIIPKGSGFAARVHTAGPLPGRPVVLTEYLVLAAIEQGRLSLPEALDLGLIRIHGDTKDGQIEALLLAGIDS